jgi:AraC-like DNA-binding protein
VRAHPQAETLFVEESVINLLNDVLDAAYEDTRRSALERRRARDLTERTREHLNRCYRSREGLGALAKEVESSVFHLCRVFKQQTGHTIHQYRTHLRLRKALELLESADADILGVALHLGFSGHSHFTRTFHCAYGVTPSEFRSDLCRRGVNRATPLLPR